MKPVVIYNFKYEPISVGVSAYISTLDHPSALVSNTTMVRTSTVLSYDKDTQNFETRNTSYVFDPVPAGTDPEAVI